MMNKFNLKGVPTATWARLIAAFLAWANLFSASIFDFQLLPFTDEEIYENVSLIISIVVSVITTWKDTPLTAAAQKGHEVTKELKGDNK